MNKIVLLGRLVRDPELRYTGTGKPVCQFTLAVDRPYSSQKGQREADFITCILWDKRGETFQKYFTKGQRALVEGRLQVRTYDAKDGSKRTAAEVVVSDFEFIESRSGSAPAESGSRGAAQAANHAGGMETFGSQVEFNDDVPF